jgi:ABC-type transporter Mla MlaB component
VPELSNSYANTIWLLNQLGQVASAGIAVMAHQVRKRILYTH